MNSEQQAIDELTAMVMGDTPQQEEAPAQESAEPTQEAKEPEVKVDVAEIIKQTMAEQGKRFDDKLAELTKQVKDAQPKEQLSEEEMMLQQAKDKLGIAQMQEQQAQMQQFIQQQQEQMQRAQRLEQMQGEFKKANPNIKLEELDKWATENGLTEQMQMGFQSGNVNIWNVLAKAMAKVGATQSSPDPITPTAQKGAETTIWEKKRKGEQVSDIEFGADLLKTAGLL